MPETLPQRPDLSAAEIVLLRQVAGGHLNAAVSRATGIPEKEVTAAITALTAKLGTAHRHRAAALGVGWGWVREQDVPVSHPTGITLPAQQKAVLTGLVAGEEPKETATRLGLTEGTVRNYVQKILAALGARSRQQAAARALLTGIAPLSALGDGWPDTTLGAADVDTEQSAGAS
ncbi:helix-turn-helix transcriptional regulator [Kitasatospora cineracea]|uniref:Regulatory LuxR family protein n=1 Tax=Kitasatospora cineracea TaxID=88074 RepID=A0A8G1XBX5_9ACTN|nr:LuxR C-terminal-related transcriptional regulator [Kitasatospora cineracea]ROR44735.1 regulatory LuxR family protein [Kitasatospora cineracea]